MIRNILAVLLQYCVKLSVTFVRQNRTYSIFVYTAINVTTNHESDSETTPL